MMSRTDEYLDAMLRHLGAAYYESLHGRAARSDVARALDTVEEHLKEQERARAPSQRPALTRFTTRADRGIAGGPAGSVT